MRKGRLTSKRYFRGRSKGSKKDDLVIRAPRTPEEPAKRVQKRVPRVPPNTASSTLPSIPLSIFRRRDLGILEALVLYLHQKDSDKYTFSEIGRLVGRNPRTVWKSHDSALRKRIGEYIAEKKSRTEEIEVPLEIFKDRGIGVLESLVGFLKRRGLNYREIAELIERNPKTVYTVVRRLEEKGRSVDAETDTKTTTEEISEEKLTERIEERVEEQEKQTEQQIQAEKIEEISVPLSLFVRRDIGILEALTRYLSSPPLSLSTREIGTLLSRSPQTIWSSIKESKTKLKTFDLEYLEENRKAGEKRSIIRIPATIFSDRNLGVLESLATYLKSEGRNYREIAVLLKRSPKTIWTVLRRAEVRFK